MTNHSDIMSYLQYSLAWGNQNSLNCLYPYPSTQPVLNIDFIYSIIFPKINDITREPLVCLMKLLITLRHGINTMNHVLPDFYHSQKLMKLYLFGFTFLPRSLKKSKGCQRWGKFTISLLYNTTCSLLCGEKKFYHKFLYSNRKIQSMLINWNM